MHIVWVHFDGAIVTWVVCIVLILKSIVEIQGYAVWGIVLVYKYFFNFMLYAFLQFIIAFVEVTYVIIWIKILYFYIAL